MTPQSDADKDIYEAAPLGRSRKSVLRACDLCRTRRIKCDNGQPCRACLQRGVPCRQNAATDGFRTLPQALREIDRLKARVKELEAELAQHKSSAPVLALGPTPSSTHLASSHPSPPCTDASRERRSWPGTPKPQWKGIYVATTRHGQPSYFGPASLLYFVSRLGSYLGKALHQPHDADTFQTRGASDNMHPRDATENTASDLTANAAPESSSLLNEAKFRPLSRAQEESLLQLFWEGYHCLMPIVDESEFRKHYASLWEPSESRRNQRKQSALVDIILALSLQYGYPFIPRQAAHPADRDAVFGDAAVAGRWYYRRSSSLLTADLESPSITTVQCYLFTAAYLCCASFQNMVYIVTAQALQTAQALGLHLEPPSNMPADQKEIRKRTWWQVLVQEAKVSIKVGRPFMVDWGQVAVPMPMDDALTASYNAASLGVYSPSVDVTWLSYSLYNQKLTLATVEVYDALFEQFGQVMQHDNLTSPYTDPHALETCAKALTDKISTLWLWAENVPEQLKLRRRSGGVPYSTDRSALELDMLAPVWLQRQRVCLELTYHYTVLNLTRPFISFYSHSNVYTPLTERQANLSVNHAISYTFIMHQTITESDLMNGWSEFFVGQWNSALTIIGFILAYPIHPSSPPARTALEKAIAVFDMFGEHFAVSADAARITRALMSKADSLAGGNLGNILPSLSTQAADDDEQHLAAQTAKMHPLPNDLAWLDPNAQIDTSFFDKEVMDWALSIDSYNSFDNFFDSSNPADPWQFGQT